MTSWRDFLRLTTMAAIFLIAGLLAPSVAAAHAGHAGHHAHQAGPVAAEESAGGAVAIELSAAAVIAQPGSDAPLDGRHGACRGPCCNVACSTACAGHALPGGPATTPPDPVVLARLGAARDVLPDDAPERRLPKPPRA